MVQDDIAKGSLVEIRIEGLLASAQSLLILAVYRKDKPPGPAGMALIKQLKQKQAGEK